MKLRVEKRRNYWKVIQTVKYGWCLQSIREDEVASCSTMQFAIEAGKRLIWKHGGSLDWTNIDGSKGHVEYPYPMEWK